MKDPLIEAAEGPTLWSATTLNGDQDMDRTESILKRRWNKIVDGDSENASSHKMNLTVNNSTFNYTTTQETTDEDMQEEEEEFYEGEEYSYEYEEELPTDVLLDSQEWKNYTQEELITTHSPAHSETLVETSSHPLTSSTDRDIDAQVILTTSEPLSQPGDIEMEETSFLRLPSRQKNNTR
ncbi:hypothetical protein F7725_021595 [Dissostichus mawsoni]|uniref:Uncharacterized protein n=1 Tax=Dissostichus mawsoni TaxID=36200 RepID=A0A7J5ZBV3_DISMA|nr:hypothetical protein F7725_021595 [Dissostichus mawsoni]